MTRRPAVPPELVGTAFRGRDAVARSVLTRDQLRSTAWRRLVKGIYCDAAYAGDSAVRLQALSLVLEADPGAVVCGRTAAWVYGAWKLQPGAALPLEITRPVNAPGTSTYGLSRRRLTLRGSRDDEGPATGHIDIDEDVVEVDGLRLTSPLRTCFDLMRTRSLVEAVVVADMFAFRTGLPLGLLDAYCSSRRRWPDIRSARAAVQLANRYARSPGETRLRLVVVLAGFDEPLVNVPVVDRVTGTTLGVPDLTMMGRDGLLLGIEYDGGYHEQSDQQDRDEVRENRLASIAGLPLLRYGRTALHQRRELIVGEVERLSGLCARFPLEAGDFRRTDVGLAI